MGIRYIPGYSVLTNLSVRNKAKIGDASSDLIGFYGTTPIAAVASPDSPDASLSQLKVAVDSIEDKLTAYGMLRGT